MDLYYGYKVAQWISRTLPRRFCYGLARPVSWIFYCCDRRGREAVKANLRQILSFRGETVDEARIRRSARETFLCFGKHLVDFFRHSQFSPDDLGRVIEVENPEYVRQAAASGKGVICISAHYGNWEMGGAVFPAMGFRFHAVVLPQPAEKMNRLFQAQRRGRGMDVIFLGKSAAPLMRALRRGELVGLLADLDFSGQNNTAPLFGKPAYLPRGPAYLAHRMGVPILPAFVRRREDDSMVLTMYPPILPEGLTQEEIQARVGTTLEEVIGEHPSQWFVFRDFWNRANGSPLASPPPHAEGSDQERGD